MMTEAERDLQRFEDILKEIGLIRESLKGLDKDAFLSSEDKKAAAAHHLTVIGEAAMSTPSRRTSRPIRCCSTGRGKRSWGQSPGS